MLNPFVDLLSNIISLVNFALTVWVVLGLLLYFDIVNASNPLINKIQNVLDAIFNPLLQPIRKRLRQWLPQLQGVDLSPVILFLGLHFIDSVLYHWFYSI